MKNISIKDETHKKLKKIADRESISMSNFLENAVKYFEKTKLNPKTDVLSVKEEIIKLEKRTNTVIGFIRKFEQDNLIPVFEEIKKMNIQINELSGDFWNTEDYNRLVDLLNPIDDRITELKATQKTLQDVLAKVYKEFKNDLLQQSKEQHLELLNAILSTKTVKKSIRNKYSILD